MLGVQDLEERKERRRLSVYFLCKIDLSKEVRSRGEANARVQAEA